MSAQSPMTNETVLSAMTNDTQDEASQSLSQPEYHRYEPMMVAFPAIATEMDERDFCLNEGFLKWIATPTIYSYQGTIRVISCGYGDSKQNQEQQESAVEDDETERCINNWDNMIHITSDYLGDELRVVDLKWITEGCAPWTL